VTLENAIVSLGSVLDSKINGCIGEKGGTTMKRFGVFAVVALALAMMALNATAQRRGGAVRGGVRGAVVGEVVGGESGAETGAKIGAITGATRSAAQRVEQRNAMTTESQALVEYETTAEYKNAQHSNFSEAPPDVIGDSSSAEATTAGKEAVISKDGKPVMGITYPAEWKQKTGERFVAAASKGGQAWSMLATIEGAKDKESGIDKVKAGLEKYLKDIEYDDLTKTERGALVVTGTGKGKKSGVNVVFAAAVGDSGAGQLVGVAFVVDKDLEDRYKETVRGICQTLRSAKEFTDKDKDVKKQLPKK
jgi:hypothetical protein